LTDVYWDTLYRRRGCAGLSADLFVTGHFHQGNERVLSKSRHLVAFFGAEEVV
jgi:hypothetical protein